MTPKEKAESLVREYNDLTLNVEADDYINQYTSKQCALIAIEEVINSMTVATSVYLPFWQDVKSEIKQL